MWKWWGKKKQAAVAERNELAIHTLMLNLCNLDSSVPVLERAGVSRADSSKIYNLTVIACASYVLELPPEQMPAYYELVRFGASPRQIRFDECEVYQRARAMVRNYGPAYVTIGMTSGMCRALNRALQQLGDVVEIEKARVRLMPPQLPVWGSGDFRAQILPALQA